MHINVDIVGPLPVSQGYTYLFMIIDHFTRSPGAYPLMMLLPTFVFISIESSAVVVKIKNLLELYAAAFLSPLLSPFLFPFLLLPLSDSDFCVPL